MASAPSMARARHEAPEVTSRRDPHRSAYGPYAGGDPLAPPVDLGEALASIGEEVMAGYSPERALREYLRRGGREQRGLDDLARAVAQRRAEMLQRHNLGGTLARVKELLDHAVLAERKHLARDLDDDARFQEVRLAGLAPTPAAAVASLSDYSWRSSEARAAYEQIKDLLGRELLDQRFAGMKQALEQADDGDRAAVAAMLADLNTLLEAHRMGTDTPADFTDFMAAHGGFFPDNPQTVEELIDTLAQRAAAGQRLLNSMTAEQRAELMSLSQQAFGSPELMASLNRLDDNLAMLRPDQDWGGAEGFGGSEGLGLGDGTGVLQDLAELDALSEQLSQAYPGAQLGDIDLDALRRHLGEEAGIEARTLAAIERELRDGGLLRRQADGSLRLSPKAMRQLGTALLRDVADRMSGRQGVRELRRAGAAGEPSGSTRPWAFGDTESWDVTRTVTNAVHRTLGQGGSARSGVRLELADIEVAETEARTQAAVALLVDTSFSMAMDGRWVPMKRMALALHQLISTRFRGDRLQVIAFGRRAQVMDIEELTGLEPIWDKGTNLHHALLLAGRHFRRHAGMSPVLLIVTDGEPTSHLHTSGQVFFDYPPHPLTLALTVEELDAVTRLGASITFVRLGEDPGLARFIDSLARRSGGRVVAPEADDLGAAVVGSYLGGRRR